MTGLMPKCGGLAGRMTAPQRELQLTVMRGTRGIGNIAVNERTRPLLCG